jgi:hypothetical protein
VKPSEIDQTIRLLEQEWKDTCGILDQKERALVETYLGFLRCTVKSCIENGCRVWFRSNRVVHWGEGGFGHLSILLPAGEPAKLPDLPAEIRFITDLSDERLGEEITLATLERITYKLDHWL